MNCLSLSLLVCLFVSACSSGPTHSPADDEIQKSRPTSALEYEKILEKYSAGDLDYNGFYNSFGFHAAVLNSELIEATVRHQTNYYMWDKSRSEAERDKLFKSAAESTSVFLSFFTPEKRNDNLSSDKSIWRVLLDINGKRYVGKIKKLKTNLSELLALYPFHTRWNTPYLVSFPVSVSQAETQPARLTITGPLGSRNIDFQAKSQ